MSLQDRITHAAAVAKWKADQQARLLKTQGLIREIESKIRSQKAVLADTTLKLYTQGQLAEDKLNQICGSIAELHEEKEEKIKTMESIKNESSPELTRHSLDYPISQDGQLLIHETSGLVCPECSRELVGRFCPEHGVEGVPDEVEQPVLEPGQLICPECSRPLSVQFCPEHGLEGIFPNSGAKDIAKETKEDK